MILMDNVKFSIIVPVYCVEKYIGECVNSVLNQSYDNWELLLIDDGSTDGTIDYLNKLTHNKRIRVIFSNHKGVSTVRNIGLKCAIGDYVVFLDSDDYLETWLLEYINTKLKRNKPDIFIGMFNTQVEGNLPKTCESEKLQKRYINKRSHSELLEYFYNIRLIFTVWRFIVKRDVITNNNIFFKENILHEDEDWVTRMLIHIKSAQLIERPFYNYRIRNNSIMTNTDYGIFRLKNDSRYMIACNFIDMAEKSEEQYVRDFLYRCAYKNIRQIYSDVKKKSNPHYPKRGI